MYRKLIAVVDGSSYTRYITICGSVLWFSYVSLEVKL